MRPRRLARAPPAVAHADTATRFLRSILAATFSQAWRVGVTFATHLVLRRLVPPADWGLYVWAEVVFLVLGAVRDLGLNAHVLRLRPKPFGNLLAVELVWGGVLGATAALASPLLLHGLADPHPELVPAMRALALFLFFEGLATVPLVYFDGELAVARAVVPELLRNACYAVLAISLALGGAGVWSLVIAQVAGAATFAASLWSRAAGRLPLTWLPGQTLRLLASSYRLASIWLLVLLVRYIDRLIVGARFSAEVLGTYEFAYWAAFIVPAVVLQPIGRVAFPLFIAYAADRRRLFEAYRVSTLLLLCLEVPAAWFLFFNAGEALRLMGGAAWAAAPAFLRILCFAPLADPFGRLGGEILAAQHRDWLWIAATACSLVSFAGAGWLLTGLIGPAGMAWANYLPAGGLVLFLALRRLAPDGLSRLNRDLAWVYLAPVPLLLAARIAAGGALELRLALSLPAVAAALAVYGWRFGSMFRRFFAAHPLEQEPEAA